MYRSTYSLLIVLACVIGSACNDETENPNPLVGSWIEAVSPSNWDDPRYTGHCEGPDLTFDGTWLFENDGSYRLEFSEGTIAGSYDGYSSGTYELISDSVLVLDITERKYTDPDDRVWTFSGERETLYVAMSDSMFTSHYPHSACLRFWRRQ